MKRKIPDALLIATIIFMPPVCSAAGGTYHQATIREITIAAENDKQGCIAFKFRDGGVSPKYTNGDSVFFYLNPSSPVYRELAAALLSAKFADKKVRIYEERTDAEIDATLKRCGIEVVKGPSKPSSVRAITIDPDPATDKPTAKK